MLAVQIRPFQESDSATVIELWTSVFGYATAHNDPARSIRRKLAHESDLFYVAEVDQSVVGTVMGGYDGHRGWIYSLAVRPEFRRHKIGTALVRHVEGALMARGCPKINLQVVGANAATVEFYTRLGYAIEDRISLGKVTGCDDPENTQ